MTEKPKGQNCPLCNSRTKVLASNNSRRRRQCLKCKHRFSTTEVYLEYLDKLIENQQKATKGKLTVRIKDGCVEIDVDTEEDILRALAILANNSV